MISPVYLSPGHELTGAQRLKVSATTLIIVSSLGAVLGPGTFLRKMLQVETALKLGGGFWFWVLQSSLLI